MTDPEDITIYAVRLSASAALQTSAALEWINDNAGISVAEDWEAGLQEIWSSLATFPNRFPVAMENRIYQAKHPGPPLRVCLYHWRRSTWRLLLTAHQATNDDQAYVIIHQMRHGAQKLLKKWPEEA